MVPPYPALPPFQVCPSVFVVPGSYHRRGGSRHTPMSNNDEELLQYAIHQSLLESRRAPGQVRTINTQLTIFSGCFFYCCCCCCFIPSLELHVCVIVGGQLGRW